MELLRAQQQNLGRGRNLGRLRARASALLESLAADDLITALEDRIGDYLRSLSAGVTRTWPYVRGQVIDDTYLARVLELMLAVLEGREHARPLGGLRPRVRQPPDIAVTLAAIPDNNAALALRPRRQALRRRPCTLGDDAAVGEGASIDGELAELAANLIRQARAERDSERTPSSPRPRSTRR